MNTPSRPDVAGSSSLPDLRAPGIWRRMACWMYEGVLLFAVVFMAGWLFSTLGQMRDAMDPRRPLLQVFVFVVFAVYFSWLWSRGQTLAMKTWNIRIVDRFGRPITQARALLRYVLSWVWFLPPLAVLGPLHLGGGEVAVLVAGWVAVWALLSRFHPQGQFWHDALAGTRLVPSND
ncbi:RDD family protein [Ramlibacter sp. AN1015]|uniref:RDD family protein n=1 Tax=Ramlibacter sp. AN1015 TaxID=3133428 RepID=UPI0030C0E075